MDQLERLIDEVTCYIELDFTAFSPQMQILPARLPDNPLRLTSAACRCRPAAGRQFSAPTVGAAIRGRQAADERIESGWRPAQQPPQGIRIARGQTDLVVVAEHGEEPLALFLD